MRLNKLYVVLVLFLGNEVAFASDSIVLMEPFHPDTYNSSLYLYGESAAADYVKGYEAYELGDYKASIAKWASLSEQNVGIGDYALGVMYANGKGVQQDKKVAFDLFTKAAAQGHPLGQTALKVLTKSAEQGHVKTQINLGIYYSLGSNGVSQNSKKAVKWYTKAAKQGNAMAQGLLATMYRDGKGVLTDYKRAYMWWDLATYNGRSWESEYKEAIAKKMTLADISKAQEMSYRCLESDYNDC